MGWASRRAQETGDAFLEPIFIAFQNVQPAVTVFKMYGFVRVVLRHRGLEEHGPKSDGKPLGQRRSGIRDLSK
jgi:hypothetical protein